MEDSAREDRLLMLALTGEPLPGDDPDAPAVAADVALLRDQIRGLGDALAAPRDPEPVPVVRAPAPVRRRRPLRIALGGLVAACAAGLVGGMVWLAVSAPGTGDSNSVSDKAAAGSDSGAGSGKSGYSPEMHLACSRVLVEGTVVSVTPRADGDVRVVLDVERYYRPERSAKQHPTFAVTLDGSARQDLRPGVYTLVRTPVRAGDRQDWETGPGVGDAREEILGALPGAEGLNCEGPHR
ncbi:DUF4131 domain-containing protein [Streptomyces kunmingensis]|uniref:DUF4131 domain-containing protein n=1 Tax=Streptomyces kunmingensis TaxID=68225 RepID=A0ABU6CDI5_9ACTN|nr:hypothetical protein [Streptomyces kunmingensis]MEB3962430.1 DUF4131 domain-containing protein [Streptomyces kunmingensis]